MISSVCSAIQIVIQSIGSHQRMNTDDVHRQMILFSLDLLCRYLLVLEKSILNDDQQQTPYGTPNGKKRKRSVQTCQIDWCINERDEILLLCTNLIKLDLRQFWHEAERLEDQQIGKSVDESLLSHSRLPFSARLPMFV